MHQLKLCKTISESKITHINLKLFLKTSDLFTFTSGMDAPHSIVLMQCIGEVLRCGRTAKPSTNFCERSEQIEFLKFLNTNLKGGLIV